ncbi:23S rRNA (uracil(1939)-C(5))-methyltransferase RlmD [Brassicibacter mesophilus]|uniref:23S rRNA (uracil(1939)-C(5))-methyltransferase RlmD n=1 Tax=Brassicibacter mesophilus TaxID=745119 RepID=UPI003D20C360
MSLPVNRNDIVEVEIIDISHEGTGVAKIDGFTVFVEGGLLGDTGKARIIDIKKNFALGKMIEITNPSMYRVEPKCSISNICGGCQLQGLSYDAQLEIKTNKVINDMKRIGKLDDVIIHKTIGMDKPFRYRNKAQIPVGLVNNKTSIGFYKKGSHNIIDTNSCIIQHSISDKVTEVVREYMSQYKVMPYDSKSGKGIVRHILTKISFKTTDTMIVIVTNGRKLPYKDELVNKLKESIPNLRSIVHNINSKRTNQVMGPKSITIHGDDKIVDYIDELKFNISPESFFQVNSIQTEVLYNKALEYAELKGNEIVFDIYCGIGTISLFLAQRAKKVYGIEVVSQAIKDAKENAKINGIDNVEFFDGTAEEIFPMLYKKGIRADVIVLDPPRKGCDQSVLDTIVKMQPEKVVYVSCNPSTLARDLKYLDENGYKTVEVQPVDMFPQTGHCEVVTLLVK